MAEPSLLIDIKNLSFEFDDHRSVLNNLNLKVYPQDRIGLIGANGSGKTTLFHLIMGLLSPTTGALEIFGRLRSRQSDFREVRAKIGFVFQDADDQLFCPTVAEDVAFGPLNLGKSHDEVHHIMHRTLDRLGLNGFENRVPYKLSGGEKKLVSLATVLAMEPEMLLLDEPTTGLDEKTVTRIVDILLSLNLPYIIISHERDFLNLTTNKTLEMVDGALIDRIGNGCI